MKPNNRRLFILIAATSAALLLVAGGAVLADAYGLVGSKEDACCANGFEPGRPEPPRPIPADKI